MQFSNSPFKSIGLRILALLLLVTVILSAADTASAQSSEPIKGPSDPAEVKTFVDGLMNGYLEKYNISGAIVAVVGGGQTLYAQGYGSANIAKNIPVDPEKSLFRIGSTSKLFTWVAVMQLVEQGKIDLDADVNIYLDIKLENPFSTPVTMRHLMSHTAGFEEANSGLYGDVTQTEAPLGDIVKQYPRAIVREPGQITAYSNYGAALAGYIVELVSGVPFDQYIEENIYQPLNMQRSTFRQPLPENLAGDLALPYAYKGDFVEQPFFKVNFAPAGSMSSTADDMAKFMIALMQDDCQASTCLLQPETIRQMGQRSLQKDLRIDGMGLGFMEAQLNGIQYLYHGGDLPPYHGDLEIQPESKTGFYICVVGNPAPVGEFSVAYAQHYFGFGPEIPTANPVTPVEQLTGLYRWTRSNYTTTERFAEVTGIFSVKVSKNSTGGINIGGAASGGAAPANYVEIEPLVFRSTDGYSTAVFQPDPDGHGMIFHMTGTASMMAFEQVPWYENPELILYVLIGCAVLMLSFLLTQLINLFVKRKSTTVGAKRARTLLVILSLVMILVVAAQMFLINDETRAVSNIYPVAVLAAGWVTALLVLTVVISAAIAWARSYWKVAGRIHYTLAALACLAILWPLYHWNVIEFLL